MSKRHPDSTVKLPPDDGPPLEMPAETARLVRLYIERVCVRINRLSACPTYKSAFNTAVRLLRESKPD